MIHTLDALSESHKDDMEKIIAFASPKCIQLGITIEQPTMQLLTYVEKIASKSMDHTSYLITIRCGILFWRGYQGTQFSIGCYSILPGSKQ